MRIVVQRCAKACVRVGGNVVSETGRGLLLLVGIGREDTLDDLRYAADKVSNLRIFEDGDGKMNLSVLDIQGDILSISQFTLYGDVRKGRRPNFMAAANPVEAKRLYSRFNDSLREYGITVETGVFGAMMDVDFVNDGPVTLLVDSKKEF
jgi:D-tyrosyl-tRNA(Tyr) deacylase